MVSGTSIASGWGDGKQKNNPDPQNYSWINYFANSTNAQNVWNHSYVSKPPLVTIEHTMLFCEQYLERYGSYENLFVIAEFLLPQNTKWPELAVKGSNNEIVTPIVVQRKDGVFNVEYGNYTTIFIRHQKDLNLLETNVPFSFIGLNQIEEADLTAHGMRLQKFANSDESNLVLRINKTREDIHKFQNWLFERNIPHLFFWACGTGRGFLKMVDKAILPVVKQNRFVPMTDFTCFSKAEEWSIQHDNFHPDQQGHKKIAEYLYDYVVKHDLLTPPLTKHTEDTKNG